MEFKRRHFLSLCLIMTSFALSQAAILFRCDFEDNNLCEMEQDTTDSQCRYDEYDRPQCETGTYNWLLWTGSTPSDHTGPDGGYKGSRYYIYMRAYNLPAGLFTRIIIINDLLRQYTGLACVEFAYHMFDDRRSYMGKLELIQRVTGKADTTLWSRSGHQGNAWHLKRVSVTLLGNDQIIWKGIVGDGETSDIAIDDIAVYDETCELSTTVKPTTTVATTSTTHQETSTIGKSTRRQDVNMSTTSTVVTDSAVTLTYPHQNGNNGMNGVTWQWACLLGCWAAFVASSLLW